MSTYWQAHALERLVAARHQVLARAPLAVRARPHEIARLRRDDHLVAERVEILAHQRAEVFLGGSRRRAVVVSQVEMRDAEIEGAARDGAAVLEDVDVAEVVPQAQRNRGQPHAAGAHAVVAHRLVAVNLRAGSPWRDPCCCGCRRAIGARAGAYLRQPQRQNQEQIAAATLRIAGTATGSARDQPDSRAQQGHAQPAAPR